MDASPLLLPAAHTKELRLHALGSPVNAGIQMLQLLLLLVQKDNALMTQLQLQMALVIRSKQPAELKELDASMLPNRVPPIPAPNRNVMLSKELMLLRDVGIPQLLLPQLLVLLSSVPITLQLLLILNARPS